MKRVLSIGSATVDLFLQHPDAREIRRVTHPSPHLCINEGIKIDVEQLHVTFGGGALNAAATLLRQGWSVTPSFMIGDDEHGNIILESLRAYGLNTQYHHVSTEHHTGTSVIIPSPQGNASLLVHRGANNDLRLEHIPRELYGEVDLLYCAPLSGAAGTILPEITRIMRPLCPLIVACLNRYQATQWDKIAPALPFIDILCCNAHEARCLMETLIKQHLIRPQAPAQLHRNEQETASLPQLLHAWNMTPHGGYYLMQLAAYITQLGVQMVIITNGAEGAYVATREALFFQSLVPGPIVNTVGAGDAFAATFAGLYAHGSTIQEALERSLINVAAVLHSIDAHSGLLTAQEITASPYRHQVSPLQHFTREMLII
jgi:sugar/nucleoside kinase (ribokinase family)